MCKFFPGKNVRVAKRAADSIEYNSTGCIKSVFVGLNPSGPGGPFLYVYYRLNR
jgi:hypothetical protein